jgi:hypothetical protein
MLRKKAFDIVIALEFDKSGHRFALHNMGLVFVSGNAPNLALLRSLIIFINFLGAQMWFKN